MARLLFIVGLGAAVLRPPPLGLLLLLVALLGPLCPRGAAQSTQLGSGQFSLFNEVSVTVYK